MTYRTFFVFFFPPLRVGGGWGPILNGKFHYFKQAVYAERETNQSDKLEELSADPVCIKYLQYQKHLIVDTFPKIHAWSCSHRISNNLPTSNNTVEASFRYTREDQFNRHKAYKSVVGTEFPQ